MSYLEQINGGGPLTNGRQRNGEADMEPSCYDSAILCSIIISLTWTNPKGLTLEISIILAFTYTIIISKQMSF